LVTCGATSGADARINLRHLFFKAQSLLGSTMGTQNDFTTVMNLVFGGKLQVPVDQTFPLKNARAAQERLESGQQLGKVTLLIG